MEWYKVVLSSLATMLSAGTAYFAWGVALPWMQSMFATDILKFACLLVTGWFGGISISICLLLVAFVALFADY